MKIDNIIKHRNNTLDFIKAFAIILVILGHAIQLGSGNAVLTECTFFDDFLYKFIYSFHMPLFMLISGYLMFYSVNKRCFKKNLLIKIKSIIFPLLVWNVFITMFDFIKYNVDLSFKRVIVSYLNEFIGNLWFLWAIFYCSIIVLLINKFLKDNIFVYFILVLTTVFFPDTIIIDLSTYKYMLPYFLIGYLFSKYDYKILFYKKYFKFIFMSFIFIFVIMFLFYKRNYYIYNSGVSIWNKEILNQIYIDIYRFLIGFFGSVIVIYIFILLSKYIKGVASKFLLFVGQNTMGIYIFTNFLLIYLVPIITFKVNGINYFINIVESMICLLISLLIILVIKKSRILTLIFLGGR